MTSRARNATGTVSPENFEFIAKALACPHSWGAKRSRRIVEPDGSHREGEQSTCARCGIRRVAQPDGSGVMLPADGISATPPSATHGE